jgi:hypothetical protein
MHANRRWYLPQPALIACIGIAGQQQAAQNE